MNMGRGQDNVTVVCPFVWIGTYLAFKISSKSLSSATPAIRITEKYHFNRDQSLIQHSW